MSQPVRVALVLGGGGFVGHAWHVGILAGVADATGWDARSAEVIVGTSAGAVVAAELRAGHRPADLLLPGVGATPTAAPRPVLGPRSYRPAAPAVVAGLLRRRGPASLGLAAACLLPRGRRDPAVISDAVAGLFPGGAPWPTGLRVCATRLVDGKRVVLAGPEPDLATAVAASCAMAGFFTPVVIDGVEHIDGGAGSVTNADAVAGDDVDLVLVSSPMSLEQGSVAPARGMVGRVSRRQRLGHAARLARELAELRASGAVAVGLEPGSEELEVLGRCRGSMDFGRRAAVADAARTFARRRFSSGPLAEVATILTAAGSGSAPGVGVP